MASTAIGDARVREVMEYYLLNLEGTVPRNTVKTYKLKQQEWKDWCSKNWDPIPEDWATRLSAWPLGRPLPGDLVNEGKLLLFMKAEVVTRAPRKGARLKKQRKRRLDAAVAIEKAAPAKRQRRDEIVGATEFEEDDDDEPVIATPSLELAYKSVRTYISVIQRLYDERKSRHINPAPRPQGIALKAVKKSILAAGTIKDAYTKAQLFQHHDAAWRHDSGDMSCLLRTQVDFFFWQSYASPPEQPPADGATRLLSPRAPQRGQKSREFPTYALVIVMNQGKTNQHGRMEYGAALRHCDVRCCLVSAMAFYFFWHWQLEGQEPFHNFQHSEDWYDIKVLRRSAKESTKELSAQTANAWISRLYAASGIRTSKVSHAPRVATAQNADMDGVSEGQVNTACGQWNSGDQMTSCYLTSLPFEFMRSIADFDPDWSESYFPPPDTIKPLFALRTRVWPSLNEWKYIHDTGASSGEANMAAGAFLVLLDWFRDVLLQDAVFLQKLYPRHPLFQNPVFQSPQFAAYALQVENACHTTEEDSHMATIDRAIPAVAEKLRALSSQQTATNVWIERSFVELAQHVQRLEKKIDELSRASYTVTIGPGSNTAVQRLELPKRGRPRAPSRRSAPAPTTAPFRRAASPGSSSSTGEEEPASVSQPDPASRPQQAPVEANIPRFEFPLDIGCIPDLWRLWRYGRASMPSIESLEAEYGAAWRPKSQKSVFCGRKAIVDFILRKSRERGGEASAAEHSRVIEQREKLCPKWSLDKVTKAIKNGDLERRWPPEA
ncbi:hypothetical protein C7999DRAFT_39914 [Corynascus novoguineensis]|uniref:Uncharacterized protein n=1 Tax=Corynascus novoguineensis TaxID=1126955 RepID=A0AAN7CV22_9PEZI|nr:hypothetical protein C7999DRAFT_39914 [Corynascus novoguineensis]